MARIKKPKLGRPRKPRNQVKRQINVKLSPKILKFLSKQPNKTQAIEEAMIKQYNL